MLGSELLAGRARVRVKECAAQLGINDRMQTLETHGYDCGPRCKAQSAMRRSMRVPQTRGTATALAVAKHATHNARMHM